MELKESTIVETGIPLELAPPTTFILPPPTPHHVAHVADGGTVSAFVKSGIIDAERRITVAAFRHAPIPQALETPKEPAGLREGLIACNVKPWVVTDESLPTHIDLRYGLHGHNRSAVVEKTFGSIWRADYCNVKFRLIPSSWESVDMRMAPSVAAVDAPAIDKNVIAAADAISYFFPSADGKSTMGASVRSIVARHFRKSCNPVVFVWRLCALWWSSVFAELHGTQLVANKLAGSVKVDFLNDVLQWKDFLTTSMDNNIVALTALSSELDINAILSVLQAASDRFCPYELANKAKLPGVCVGWPSLPNVRILLSGNDAPAIGAAPTPMTPDLIWDVATLWCAQNSNVGLLTEIVTTMALFMFSPHEALNGPFGMDTSVIQLPEPRMAGYAVLPLSARFEEYVSRSQYISMPRFKPILMWAAHTASVLRVAFWQSMMNLRIIDVLEMSTVEASTVRKHFRIANGAHPMMPFVQALVAYMGIDVCLGWVLTHMHFGNMSLARATSLAARSHKALQWADIMPAVRAVPPNASILAFMRPMVITPTDVVFKRHMHAAGVAKGRTVAEAIHSLAGVDGVQIFYEKFDRRIVGSEHLPCKLTPVKHAAFSDWVDFEPLSYGNLVVRMSFALSNPNAYFQHVCELAERAAFTWYMLLEEDVGPLDDAMQDLEMYTPNFPLAGGPYEGGSFMDREPGPGRKSLGDRRRAAETAMREHREPDDGEDDSRGEVPLDEMAPEGITTALASSAVPEMRQHPSEVTEEDPMQTKTRAAPRLDDVDRSEEAEYTGHSSIPAPRLEVPGRPQTFNDDEEVAAEISQQLMGNKENTSLQFEADDYEAKVPDIPRSAPSKPGDARDYIAGVLPSLPKQLQLLLPPLASAESAAPAAAAWLRYRQMVSLPSESATGTEGIALMNAVSALGKVDWTTDLMKTDIEQRLTYATALRRICKDAMIAAVGASGVVPSQQQKLMLLYAQMENVAEAMKVNPALTAEEYAESRRNKVAQHYRSLVAQRDEWYQLLDGLMSGPSGMTRDVAAAHLHRQGKHAPSKAVVDEAKANFDAHMEMVASMPLLRWVSRGGNVDELITRASAAAKDGGSLSWDDEPIDRYGLPEWMDRNAALAAMAAWETPDSPIDYWIQLVDGRTRFDEWPSHMISALIRGYSVRNISDDDLPVMLKLLAATTTKSISQNVEMLLLGKIAKFMDEDRWRAFETDFRMKPQQAWIDKAASIARGGMGAVALKQAKAREESERKNDYQPGWDISVTGAVDDPLEAFMLLQDRLPRERISAEAICNAEKPACVMLASLKNADRAMIWGYQARGDFLKANDAYGDRLIALRSLPLMQYWPISDTGALVGPDGAKRCMLLQWLAAYVASHNTGDTKGFIRASRLRVLLSGEEPLDDGPLGSKIEEGVQTHVVGLEQITDAFGDADGVDLIDGKGNVATECSSMAIFDFIMADHPRNNLDAGVAGTATDKSAMVATKHRPVSGPSKPPAAQPATAERSSARGRGGRKTRGERGGYGGGPSRADPGYIRPQKPPRVQAPPAPLKPESTVVKHLKTSAGTDVGSDELLDTSLKLATQAPLPSATAHTAPQTPTQAAVLATAEQSFRDQSSLGASSGPMQQSSGTPKMEVKSAPSVGVTFEEPQ